LAFGIAKGTKGMPKNRKSRQRGQGTKREKEFIATLARVPAIPNQKFYQNKGIAKDRKD